MKRFEKVKKESHFKRDIKKIELTLFSVRLNPDHVKDVKDTGVGLSEYIRDLMARDRTDYGK